MVTQTHELSGVEKASVLLMSLDKESSEEVLKRLSPEHQEILGAQIVKMRHVRTVTQRRVLDEVSTMMRKGLIKEPVVREEPLKWMEKLSVEQIAMLLEQERPHNVALVIAHLKPKTAAGVLSAMDDNGRNHAAHRLANMRGVSAEAVRAVDEVIRKRYEESMPSSVITRVSTEPQTPEDLIFMPDDELRAALAQLSTEEVHLILQVASDDLRSAIHANLSEEAALELRKSGAIHPKVKEIEAAQRKLLQAVKG